MRIIRWIAPVVGLGLVAGVMAIAAMGQAPGGIDPANFTDPVANPFFPLKAGTVTILKGSEDGDHLLDRVKITSKHHSILSVPTVVVKDVITSQGVLVEKTTDWYAADNDGNVWYFGEDTATYKPDGSVESREGSWQAGVNGARAGIIMPADPRPTDAYRQEFLPDHAEDQAWIVQRGLRAHVPYGNVDHVVRSFEWTELEPRVVSEKFYAKGLGIVMEKDVAGGNEIFRLIKVLHT